VKLWERTELENHCSKNPIAVLRLFADALSPQGKLEVAKTRLRDYALLTDVPNLALLWGERATLDIDPLALLTLVSSEMANGNVEERSWGMFVEKETVLDALGVGLINSLYFTLRAHYSGVRTQPMVGGLAYLTLVALVRAGEQVTSEVLGGPWDTLEGREFPNEMRKMVLRPILETVLTEIRDVCTSDCRRIITDRAALSEKQVKSYLQRLSPSATTSKEEGILTIESSKVPCKLGLPLDEDHHCPLCAIEDGSADLHETLSVIKFVADRRRHKDDS
jgi:hypothetical protein